MVDVSKFLERAEEAFRKRNFQYAIQMYLEALQVDPEHIDARRALRSVLLKVEESGEKIQPPKAQTIVLSRDPKVMLAEFEKAVVKTPRSAKHNMRVAETLRTMGAHESAGYVFQYVITQCEKGKDNVEAMKSGAQAFIDAGKPELAQTLLQKALRLAPNDRDIADLQRNLAASSTLSKISGASSSRDMLKSSDQSYELELLNKKVLSVDEIKTALKIVNAKLEANPTEKSWVKKKAELFGKAKNFDKAYDWLMSRYDDLDKAPDIVELAVRYKNSHFDYMVERCKKKMQEEPDKAEAWNTKAKEYEAQKHAFHLDEYKRQVLESPADMDKRYAYGQALFEDAQYDEAVPHLQRAARAPKLAKRVSVILGRCFNEMGRYELAAKQLETARESITEADEELNAEVRYWLAVVYAKSGNIDGAKGLFQELFMENASFRDVGQRLDSIMAKG